jgi:addiction module RelE/StbE family toxin
VRRQLLRSTAFVRAAKRFIKKEPNAARAIHQTLVQLEADAFNPQLRTHKLKGNLTGCWACSAGYDLRIVFEFVSSRGQESILLLTMGTHDEVY